jgi:hypothetical protein
MHTIVELGNSNCPWCVNAMIERLRARPLVREVRSSMAAGCLEVEHGYKVEAELVARIHDDLRGWVNADNGEAVMVQLDVHPEGQCPFRPVGT